MAVAVTEEHQCRVIKWTEAREAKCFLADELDTDMQDEHGNALLCKLQLHVPKPNFGKEAKRPKQLCLHTLDKCDPLGLGLLWDTCFLRLMDCAHNPPVPIPLTRELLHAALAGLRVSQAVQHDLFQDAAVVCDAPSQHVPAGDATDASDDEQLTIKSIAEEVDLGEDEDACDDTDVEVTDQDEDEEEEFEEEEEL